MKSSRLLKGVVFWLFTAGALGLVFALMLAPQYRALVDLSRELDATQEEARALFSRICQVRADASVRTQVIEAVGLFRAKVIDVSPDALTVEATGTRSKLDALLRMLEPYGVREIVQSGVVAVGRGPKSIGWRIR